MMIIKAANKHLYNRHLQLINFILSSFVRQNTWIFTHDKNGTYWLQSLEHCRHFAAKWFDDIFSNEYEMKFIFYESKANK